MASKKKSKNNVRKQNLFHPKQPRLFPDDELYPSKEVQTPPGKGESKSGKMPSNISEKQSGKRQQATQKEDEAWMKFLNHARISKEEQSERAQVWIDAKLKRKLDKLRATSLQLPIAHILNGIISSFLEAHSEKVKKLMDEE